eukprot:2133823-Prymnesium_polylepis.1
MRKVVEQRANGNDEAGYSPHGHGGVLSSRRSGTRPRRPAATRPRRCTMWGRAVGRTAAIVGRRVSAPGRSACAMALPPL